MDVIPVMGTMIVTNPFSPHDSQHRLIVLALAITVLLMNGCQTPTFVPSVLGYKTDVTEDLHHRIQAGLFEPETDPLIVQVEKVSTQHQKRRLRFINRKSPHQLVRFSWERGSFWAQSDERKLVVIYMDREALFSHVQIATSDEFTIIRLFPEKIQHPIR